MLLVQPDSRVARDGADGKDGLPGGPRGLTGKRGERGQQGTHEKGDPGPRGLPGKDGADGEDGQIGPMPRHEWNGTKLRFEQEIGVWGKQVDLQGPKGIDAGPAYSGVGLGIQGPRGRRGLPGTGVAGGGNSWTPGGW